MGQRILLISDTHGRLDRLPEVLEQEAPIQKIIHLGDIAGQASELQRMADCPVEVVRGNNDLDPFLSDSMNIFLGNRKTMICHGHRYGVSWGLGQLEAEAELRKVSVVLYGHTHVPDITYLGGRIYLNPGSLSRPRQPGRKPTYALIEVDDLGEPHFSLRHLD